MNIASLARRALQAAIAVLLLASPALATSNTNAQTSVPSIAAMEGATVWSFYPHVTVRSYYANGNYGGGNLDWVLTPCTPDGGLSFAAADVSAGTGCWYRQLTDGTNVNMGWYGPDLSGATSAKTAMNAALAGIGTVFTLPSGTYLLNSVSNLRFGKSSQALWGSGIGNTNIDVQATVSATNPFAFSIHGVNDITVRDMTINLNGIGHVGAVGFGYSNSTTASGFNLQNVNFVGDSNAVQTYGIQLPTSGTVKGIVCNNCNFTNVQEAIVGSDGGTETIIGTQFHGGFITGCADGININAPNGTWAQGIIDGVTFTSCINFPLAFAGANTYDWEIHNSTFIDSNIEAFHIENHAHDIVVDSDYIAKCAQSTSPPFGDTGCINIITGAHDVTFVHTTVDLTQNTTQQAAGLWGVYIQGGANPEPYNIRFSDDTFKTKALSTAIVVSTGTNTPVQPIAEITDSTFTNPDTASKSTCFIQANDNFIIASGNTFINPTNLLCGYYTVQSVFADSTISGDLSTWTTWVTGASAPNRPIFYGFTVKRDDFVFDTTPSWNTLFPAGTGFHGGAALKAFAWSGSNPEFTEIASLDWDGSTLTVTVHKCTAQAVTCPASTDWRVSGGEVQVRLGAAGFSGPVTGSALVTFDGGLYP